jgi:diguanylate cyclase (GGDEF)-like protein
MLDLDNYKMLNDSLGHQMGDKILIMAAQIIQSELRASDLAARYGGDEFVILLPHTSVELASAVAERIRRQLAASSNQYANVGRLLTMSIGIASLKEHQPATADQLVAMADKALYASKDAGRDRIMVFGRETRVAG